MKKIIFTMLMSMAMVGAYAQLKVVSTGDTEVKKVLYVGQDAGANDAVVRIGQGRSASGNGLFTLTGDLAYPLYGLRFTRLANGESRIEHRGNQPLFFNAPDVGGIYRFQIQGQTRVEFTGGAIKPGVAGITNNGTGAVPWATVFATSYVTASDLRLKKDIKDLTYGLKEILQMRPVSYTYKKNEALGTQLGLIAQEVQPLVSEAVMDFELTNKTNARGVSEVSRQKTEMLNLNYIELIPVLINGIKEQQKLIEEKDDRISILEEKFAELESKLDDLSSRSSTSTIINQSEVTIASKDLASMEQNVPNPFNNVTTIDYSIPISATDAQINIFNIHGKLIKSVVIEHVGEGRLTINTADLPSGTYSYQLIVDKTPISTKKMVLTN